mmetsp:Transcript_30174/g.29478  ORF Transcript_30174/g.29478 Transcript_30174/m.29478 type:complete len:128 (+) Transcript_30174:1246-1629(+)
MIPFMNSYHALDDNKKKAMKYFIKVKEFTEKNMLEEANVNTNVIQENPYDEQFIFKHFYNNKRGLIKQHMKEEKEAQDKNIGILKKHIFRYTMPFCHFEGHNFWLLKPTKLNRGRGIHVCNSISMLK